MHFKKKKKAAMAATTICTAAICFCFFAAGAYAAPPADDRGEKYMDAACGFLSDNPPKKESLGFVPPEDGKGDGEDRAGGKWVSGAWGFGWDDDKWADEAWGFGWDDDKWADEAWGFDWDDDKWADEGWDKADEELMEAYAAHGIQKRGTLYYYQEELVYLLKNQFPDSSSTTVNTDVEGGVSIQITWNAEGEITDISHMTDEEIEKQLKRMFGGRGEL